MSAFDNADSKLGRIDAAQALQAELAMEDELPVEYTLYEPSMRYQSTEFPYRHIRALIESLGKSKSETEQNRFATQLQSVLKLKRVSVDELTYFMDAILPHSKKGLLRVREVFDAHKASVSDSEKSSLDILGSLFQSKPISMSSFGQFTKRLVSSDSFDEASDSVFMEHHEKPDKSDTSQFHERTLKDAKAAYEQGERTRLHLVRPRRLLRVFEEQH